MSRLWAIESKVMWSGMRQPPSTEPALTPSRNGAQLTFGECAASSLFVLQADDRARRRRTQGDE